MTSTSTRMRVALFAFVLGLLAVSAAGAQTLGTFKWQLQPYCNVVTLTVTQEGGVFRLDGFDDMCGVGSRSSAVGMAFPNPDGSIGIGLSIVVAPSGKPVHVNAQISLQTLSGTWNDSNSDTGVFAFGASAPGKIRGSLEGLLFSIAEGFPGWVIAGRVNGTSEAPLPVQSGESIGVFATGGHAGGGGLQISAAFMGASATENWSANATGAKLEFFTTANGAVVASPRMTIDHDGYIGIGATSPNDRLDVDGDIRVGTSLFNGCLKNNNGSGMIGACSSDVRFKRDITPFAPVLDRVAALRPVHYYWRAAEFPRKAFGSEQAYGLIAQDVEQVLPELVTIDEEGYKAVDYSKLPLLAIQAIKELRDKNDALERRLTALESSLIRER